MSYARPGAVFYTPNSTDSIGKWCVQGEQLNGWASERFLVDWHTAGSNVSVEPIIGHRGAGFWQYANGTLEGSTLRMVFVNSEGQDESRIGQLAVDRSKIEWALANSSLTYKPWANCTMHPVNCTGTTRHSQRWMKVKYDVMRTPDPKGYVFNIPSGHTYDLEWDLVETNGVDVENFDFHISDMQSEDSIWFRMSNVHFADNIDVPSSVNKSNSLPAKVKEVSTFVVEPPNARC